MDPMIRALLVLAVVLAPVAALGFYWAKQEREEFRAKFPIASGAAARTPSSANRKTAGPPAENAR